MKEYGTHQTTARAVLNHSRVLNSPSGLSTVGLGCTGDGDVENLNHRVVRPGPGPVQGDQKENKFSR